MATYQRREVTTTVVQFVVPAAPPWGASWAEVQKAIHAAVAELRNAGEGSVADDRISVLPSDEALIVSYKKRETHG